MYFWRLPSRFSLCDRKVRGSVGVVHAGPIDVLTNMSVILYVARVIEQVLSVTWISVDLVNLGQSNFLFYVITADAAAEVNKTILIFAVAS